MLQTMFFKRDTAEVARDLLGKTLVRNTPKGTMKGIIVETEAYLGYDDPGCHAYRGITPRTEIMFGEAGYYYVYFIYGMYYCLNIVTRDKGVPEAVLIRALKPIEGIDLIRVNRPRVKKNHELANGPGKLTVAYNIDKQFNGCKVTNDELFLLDEGYKVDYHDIVETTRIGLTQGADLPLRYYPASMIDYVSKK